MKEKICVAKSVLVMLALRSFLQELLAARDLLATMSSKLIILSTKGTRKQREYQGSWFRTLSMRLLMEQQ